MSRLLSRAGLWGALLVTLVWSAFPIYWMIVSSLRLPRDLFSAPTLFPRQIDWSFENYRTLLQLTDYPLQFFNSVVVALTVVAITLVLSLTIAYTVTRYRIRGRSVIVGGMLYAYMFPPLLVAIPLLSIMASLHLADTIVAVIIAHCTRTLPLGTWRSGVFSEAWILISSRPPWWMAVPAWAHSCALFCRYRYRAS